MLLARRGFLCYKPLMGRPKKTILYIDSENLKFYIKNVLKKKENKLKLHTVNLNKIFSSSLEGIKIDDKRFYSAKLHVHKNYIKKSKELILQQRILKTRLEKEV